MLSAVVERLTISWATLELSVYVMVTSGGGLAGDKKIIEMG